MAASPVRVIVTGATGMVGEGVVHECLISNEVEAVLVVSRKTTGIKHPKLKELLLPDFFDLSSIQSQMAGYNACLFCLGVSSVGISKETYERLTYQLTMGFATVLAAQNPGMVFCYVSGKGTDSTEKGRMHWARVKGKTENDLQKLPFRSVYCFRPGIMSPTPGLKNTLSAYKWLGWLLPLMRTVSPNSVNSLAEVGNAMIHVVTRGYIQKIIEVTDIRKLAKQR
ncbi:MAG: NAD-dependent epimerase/dehydratase family protein [Chitinophagales bacterium]